MTRRGAMKKVFLVAAMVTLSGFLYASGVFAEFGILPFDASYETATGKFIEHKNTYYIGLNVRFDLPLYFFVGGDVTTWMVPDLPTFKPFFTAYTVNTGWSYKNFEVGYEHQCSHPVMALAYNMKQPILSADKGYDKVYVRLTFKF
jgi:hypothetical protein